MFHSNARAYRLVTTLVVVLGVVGLVPPSGAGESIGEALKKGKIDIDLRYRYEFVEQDGFDENANASTIRLRLGYKTAMFYDFFAYAGFEHTEALGSERYNSTQNGKLEFPTVADPEFSQLDQFHLGWAGVERTSVVLGRQAINLDNQRFVGAVAWRQNQQTFDALMAQSKFFDKTSLFYSWICKQNAVNSSVIDHSSHLLNGSYDFNVGKLVAYAHLLEFQDDPGDSHKNFGLRFTGDHELTSKYTLTYAAEYANQSGYKDAPSTVGADYYFLEAGTRFQKIKTSVKLGYEVLGGDGVWGFRTPLATLHKFNGWADNFLATPADGLRDLYLSATGTVGGVKLVAVYHDFRADNGGETYGKEIDFAVTKWFKKRYLVGLWYADYQADSDVGILGADTKKLWLTLRLKI